MTAASRGWGPGWPNCQWSNFVTLTRADDLRLPVHRGVADLVGLMVDLTEAGTGYDIKAGQSWGAACRAISGTSTPSNHSWGLAVDVNAPSNPYASAAWHRRNARGTRPFGLAIVCDIPQKAVELWEGHGFRWGGRYVSKPDPMHFEFMGTPAQAAQYAANLRAFLSAAGSPAPKPPAPPKPKPPASTQEYAMDTLDLSNVTKDARSFVKGPHVDNLQANMIGVLVFGGRGELVNGIVNAYRVPDGVAGPGTRKALEVSQDILRYVGRLDQARSDAIAGPETWKALIEF